MLPSCVRIALLLIAIVAASGGDGDADVVDYNTNIDSHSLAGALWIKDDEGAHLMQEIARIRQEFNARMQQELNDAFNTDSPSLAEKDDAGYSHLMQEFARTQQEYSEAFEQSVRKSGEYSKQLEDILAKMDTEKREFARNKEQLLKDVARDLENLRDRGSSSEQPRVIPAKSVLGIMAITAIAMIRFVQE